MRKSKKSREIARDLQKKQLAENGVVLNGKIHFPEFWGKRKYLLNAGFLKKLQETADKEPEVIDTYGEYKTGTFLHRSTIVTITRDNDLWNIHIYSPVLPITLPIIQEVRDKYVPDYCMMVQFYPSRVERATLRGVQLCEMPGSIQEDTDAEETADAKDEEAKE